MLVGHERSLTRTFWAREVGLDLGRTPVAWVPLAMQLDEAFNPIEETLLDLQAVAFDADAVAGTGKTSMDPRGAR
jgi:hypothetical protein